MTFFDEFADAMRTGEPGQCYPYGLEHSDERAPYHVLDGDAVRSIRESSSNGGLAYCLDCGKAIFVPGLPDRGIVITGMHFKMKGVEIDGS